MFAQIRRLMLGNGVAQVIQFAAIPLLSRLYEPVHFAPLYHAQALATILAIFATLQLHLALPQARDQSEARRWARAVIALCFLICATVAPLIHIAIGNFWAALLTFCLGATNTVISLRVFQQRFASIAKFQVVRAIIIVTTQAGLQLIFHIDNLLVATVVAEIVVASLFVFQSGIGWPTKRDIRAGVTLARDRSNFTVFGTLHEAVSSAVFYAPLFLFSVYFGDAVSAQFAMANRLVWAPVVLLSASAAQVTYQRFCQLPPRTVWETLLRYLEESRRHSVWALLVGIVAIVIAPVAVHVALGSAWNIAASMVSPLVMWGLVFIASIPFRSACRALSLQKWQLAIEILLGFGFLTVFVFLKTDSPEKTLWLIAALAAIQNISLAFVIKSKVTTTA